MIDKGIVRDDEYWDGKINTKKIRVTTRILNDYFDAINAIPFIPRIFAWVLGGAIGVSICIIGDLFFPNLIIPTASFIAIIIFVCVATVLPTAIMSHKYTKSFRKTITLFTVLVCALSIIEYIIIYFS